MFNYKFRLHPSKIMEQTLLKRLELCRWSSNSLLDGFNLLRNRNLASKILDASWSKFLQLLSYKAERAGKVVVKANSRVKPERLSYDDLYRDYISVFRIKMRGRNYPRTPAKAKPLLHIPAKVVAGQAFSMKQKTSIEMGSGSQ
jgi:putative transposase